MVKILIDRSVLEQAFDAIELGWCAFEMNDYSLEKFETAKTALRAALEQPQGGQEPVAICEYCDPRHPLTEEQIRDVAFDVDVAYGGVIEFARAIERAHGIGGEA